MAKNVIEFKVGPLTLTLVLFLLLTACAWPLWMLYRMNGLEDSITQQQDDLRDAIGNAQQSLLERIASLDAGLADQRTELEQVTSLESLIVGVNETVTEQRDALHAALGSALPVNMPDEWEERLQRLIDRLKSLELPGVEASERNAFIDDVSLLVGELSLLAETQYLPQLAPLRWAVVALDAIHHSPDRDDDLLQLADDLRVIADAAPASIEKELPGQLRERADELEAMAECRLIKDTIRQTKAYLELPESSDIEETCPESVPESPVDPQFLHDSLSLYENDPNHADDVGDLLKRLKDEIAEQDAQALAERWKTVSNLAEDDGFVDQAVISLLLGEVETVRAVAELHGINIEALDDLALQIRDEEAEARERIRLGYQEWALRTIMDFEDIFEKISQDANDNRVVEIKKRLGGFGDNLSPDDIPEGIVPDDWTDDLYHRVQQAMIEFLLPIDLALLNRPIHMRYQQEFERGWDKLDKRHEQTCVAIASTMMEKRNFLNFRREPQPALPTELNELWRDKECEQ